LELVSQLEELFIASFENTTAIRGGPNAEPAGHKISSARREKTYQNVPHRMQSILELQILLALL
jgi:hypothetical protein